MILQTAINLVQNVVAQAWELQYAPQLQDYPPSAADFQLPLGMTITKNYNLTGRPGSQFFADADLVVRVLYAHIEAEEYGYILTEVAKLQDQFTRVFLDKDTYEVVGMYILQAEPERITIESGDPTFRFTGPTIEHPRGSEIWYHGFEMALTVKAQWPVSC